MFSLPYKENSFLQISRGTTIFFPYMRITYGCEKARLIDQFTQHEEMHELDSTNRKLEGTPLKIERYAKILINPPFVGVNVVLIQHLTVVTEITGRPFQRGL